MQVSKITKVQLLAENLELTRKNKELKGLLEHLINKSVRVTSEWAHHGAVSSSVMGDLQKAHLKAEGFIP